MSDRMVWRTSSYSGVNGDCVQVAHTRTIPSQPVRTTASVRDSKRPEAGHLTFPSPEWAAFLAAVRTEEL